MKKIYKYELMMADEQTIELPKHSKILTVQIQNGNICLWALVFPQEVMQKYKVRIIGTGHPAGYVDADDYIGTVQQNEGQLVWHVFANKI